MLVWPKSELGKLNIKPSAKAGEKIEKAYPEITLDGLFDFLKERQDKLDAVVVSGGEPTIHADLPEFITKIKVLGFKVKLDTNGTNPQMLKKLMAGKLIDYVAMDIKGALERYDLITEIQPDLRLIKESVESIMQSGLPYEFRTTVVPELVGKGDIEKIGELIRGAEKWQLQNFKSDTDLVNFSFQGGGVYSLKEMEALQKIGQKFVKVCRIR